METTVERCPLHGTSPQQYLFTVNGYEIFRCEDESCGLIFASPRPPDEELERIYGEAYFNNYVEGVREGGVSYALLAGYVRTQTNHRLGKLPAAARGPLLDAGCAYGFSLQAAAEGGYTPLWGVDISEHAREIAARNTAAVRLYPQILDLHLQQGTFRVITMWEFIEHVRDPWAALVRARDLLCAGGFLALSTPDVELVADDPERLRTWEHMRPPEHLYFFSRKTMRLFLEQAGFDILDVKDDVTPRRAGPFLARVRRRFGAWLPYETVKTMWLRLGAPGKAGEDRGQSFEMYASRK